MSVDACARRSVGCADAAALLLLVLAAACRTVPVAGPESPVKAEPGEQPEVFRTTPRPLDTSPQANAAKALIAQARKLYSAGKHEAALGRLERAISVNPRNGEGHYWLAQVWLAKGDKDQAQEHYKLARRYLSGRDEWVDRLQRQGSKVR